MVTKGASNFRRLFHYLRPEYGVLIAALFSLTVSTIVNLLMPYFMGNIFDSSSAVRLNILQKFEAFVFFFFQAFLLINDVKLTITINSDCTKKKKKKANCVGFSQDCSWRICCWCDIHFPENLVVWFGGRTTHQKIAIRSILFDRHSGSCIFRQEQNRGSSE